MSASATFPLVSAKAAILMDRQTGMVLWSYNPDLALPMASTTKIMTAMVILDHGADKLDQSVVVSEHASSTGGSSLLAAGDILTLRELLVSALVRSSNEATVAAAEYLTGGNVQQFVDWMNEKAQSLGLKHTHFVNPHGLYDPKVGAQHYSSARDLATMASYALTHYPLIREIVRSGRPRPVVIHTQNRGNLVVENRDKLINGPVPGIPGAIVDGVKTGFVVEAGRCLVSSASLGNWQLVAVVLNSQQMYQENLALLHYGFSRYIWKTYASSTQAWETPVQVSWGTSTTVPVGVKGILGAPVPRLEYGETVDDQVVFAGDRPSAPIARGEQIGTLEVWRNGRRIASAPAVALQPVPVAWWAHVLATLWYLTLTVLGLFIVGKIYGKIAKSHRRRRRHLAASR
jgi:D-alanyl-D-alanine carboxypeptidase (penicillin-binding protein 5/6)